ATPPAKGEFLSLIKYYKAMLKKLGVTVVTGKCAAAEEIIGAGYDAVVTATGVTPKTINLPVSEEGIEIMTANDVLAGNAIAGKDVVVVGGGSVGCETAQYLAERGSLSPAQLHFLMSRHAETPEELQRLVDRTDRNVSIVEILKKIGQGFDMGTGWPVLDDLARLGVKNHTSSKILDVKKDRVIIEETGKDGVRRDIEIPCDTIVLAVGSNSNNALYQALEGKVEKLYNLGDSLKVGKIIDAIHQAENLSMEI
ncbi:MAG: FAD-dependent oxidoreductase, partial [Lachnospiraceae bacterium]|nr:FAD-dependent oxidoreductase [Lachnospiraceae bacterium]